MDFISLLVQLSLVACVVGAPIIIFSATPRMPFWYKSGRIIFLWLGSIFFSGLMLYSALSDPEEIERWGIKEQAYQHHTLLSLWLIFFINVYIGWFEFLWRCIYRQWAWPPLRNLQYGLVSNLCILGSALLTVPIIYILIVVGLIKVIY